MRCRKCGEPADSVSHSYSNETITFHYAHGETIHSLRTTAYEGDLWIRQDLGNTGKAP